jgi:hypothetical protein
MGWGAMLRGDATDIEDWQFVLKRPFDPWVEMHGSDIILRSAALDSLNSAAEVRDHAIEMISRLNGAVALSQGARPIVLGGVIEFTSDGRLNQHVFAEGVAVGRAKVRGHAVVLGPDGQTRPATPRPSEVQGWMEVAKREALLEDALVYFGRANDWFDIYKCLECLFKLYGGEDKFCKLQWQSKEKIKLMKQTANLHRHAKNVPPANPMKIKEARSLLASLLLRSLQDKFQQHQPSSP